MVDCNCSSGEIFDTFEMIPPQMWGGSWRSTFCPSEIIFAQEIPEEGPGWEGGGAWGHQKSKHGWLRWKGKHGELKCAPVVILLKD